MDNVFLIILLLSFACLLITLTAVFLFVVGLTVDTKKAQQTSQQPQQEVVAQQPAETQPQTPAQKDDSDVLGSNKDSANVSTSSTSPAPTTKSAPIKITGSGPNGERIKGHIGKNGTKIYYTLGDRLYDKTKNVSAWFFTEEDAKAAGYRASKR
ncbi:MAG: hypothetical protein H6Q75_377 [Firmicutes bacterium]|nr:hypothetical protein [Bacillota bacterium]